MKSEPEPPERTRQHCTLPESSLVTPLPAHLKRPEPVRHSGFHAELGSPPSRGDPIHDNDVYEVQSKQIRFPLHDCKGLPAQEAAIVPECQRSAMQFQPRMWCRIVLGEEAEVEEEEEEEECI